MSVEQVQQAAASSPGKRHGSDEVIATEAPASKVARVEVAGTGNTELNLLRRFTQVVCDSADLAKIHLGVDATTNPTLIYKVLEAKTADDLLEQAINAVKQEQGGENITDELADHIVDRYSVLLAKKILSIIPGICSVELNPGLAFDADASYEAAKKMVASFEKENVDLSRIAFKLPATFEGIEACRRLTEGGYKVNLTLVFSVVQAVAGSKAGATLISPFVGRITDFYKDNAKSPYPNQDAGVCFVRDVYNVMKKIGSKTEVMGASLRSPKQCLELSGCDKLTIPPKVLEELETGTVDEEQMKSAEACLSEAKAAESQTEVPAYAKQDAGPSRPQFSWEMNTDAMATFLLSDGIRQFYAYYLQSRDLILQRLRK